MKAVFVLVNTGCIGLILLLLNYVSFVSSLYCITVDTSLPLFDEFSTSSPFGSMQCPDDGEYNCFRITVHYSTPYGLGKKKSLFTK